MDTVETAPIKLTPLQLKAWLLSAGGVALDGFDLFIMGVALPLILVRYSGPSWQTGLIASAAIIGAIIGALFGGNLTDRFGRKRLYMWDLVAFVVFAIASGFAWNVWSLIVFRSMLGLALGADYPSPPPSRPSTCRARSAAAGWSRASASRPSGCWPAPSPG